MPDVIPLGINKSPIELLKDIIPGLALGIAFWVLHLVQPAVTMYLPPLPFGVLGNVIIALMVAPVLEEVFFRGWLDSWLEEKLGTPIVSVILTALAFAAFHFTVYGSAVLGNFIVFATAFGFSIAFSIIARYTKALSGSIIAHTIINFVILGGTVFAVAI